MPKKPRRLLEWMARHAPGWARSLLLRQDPAPYRVRPEELSEFERGVARGLMYGRSNKEIARALGVSFYAVRDQVSKLLRRFGVRSRAELARRLAPMLMLADMPDGRPQRSESKDDRR
ncbi:MAG TPA: helix-turn-helix transcriptional regulator [Burkholderiaceae bacterium]|nr:helix-turn-helix transcriptional regulator [Burkholderiaceae bacterium]